MKDFFVWDVKASTYLLAFGLLVFSACESPAELDVVLGSEEEFSIDEETIKEIWYSPEWRSIVELRNESLNIISQAVGRGVTKEELKDAIAIDRNSEQAINLDNLVFQDPQRKEEFRNSTLIARKAFVDKYPQILTISSNEDNECSLTHAQSHSIIDNIDVVLEQHEHYYTLGKNMEGVDPELPPCGSWWQVGKLMACAAGASFGCAGGGPAGLVLCGWGCWCMLCNENSAVADAIC